MPPLSVASAQSHRQAASPHTRGPSRCGEGRLAVHVGTRKSLLRRATQAGNGPFLPETTVGARFQFTACCDHRGTQECGAVQGVKFVQGAAKEEVWRPVSKTSLLPEEWQSPCGQLVFQASYWSTSVCFVQSLRQKNLLSDGVYRRLRSSAGGVPRLYGLPKIHKPGIPLRPIVSFVLSPTYELSKFLASLLSPCVGLTNHHVKNSGQFTQFITTQTLTDTDVLVSFDVVSLFTRVPIARALQVSRDRLERDPSLPERTCLSVDDICNLLGLCLDATYLSFEGTVYRQVHGTAMGSPVSVVVANLVMEDIEQEALSTFHSPPLFWRRYVDDTCTALPLDLVDSLHQHLNSVDPNIQFTVEKEKDGQLAFLDILLSRDSEGSISTSVYRKPTHTDQYLNFQSHHPVAHKRSVVRTLMSRAESLSSSAVSRVQEEKHVMEALQKNGYPKGFIKKQTCPRGDETSQCDETCTTLTLPYIKGLSESIRRILSPLSIRVMFRPFTTLRQMLVHPKDPVPVSKRKGVVYSIPCAECPRTYIGQTGRSLDLRLQEHRRALKNGDVTASAVAEHVFTAGHQVDLSKASVIDYHPHTQTRCLLESWHIQHQQAPLNRERGPMPGLYATLLDWFM